MVANRQGWGGVVCARGEEGCGQRGVCPAMNAALLPGSGRAQSRTKGALARPVSASNHATGGA